MTAFLGRNHECLGTYRSESRDPLTDRLRQDDARYDPNLFKDGGSSAPVVPPTYSVAALPPAARSVSMLAM